MRNLTRTDLHQLWPSASKDLVAGILATQETAFRIAGITKAIRLAHFMAQLSHESGGGTILAESLNYSAEALLRQWPTHFSQVQAGKYGRTASHRANQEAIANLAYGGRMGNINPGDGWRYRGRGLIQITGRDGYANVGRIAGLDLVSQPDIAFDPEHAFIVAGAFWHWKGLNDEADRDSIRDVTLRVNGGTIGLAEREKWLIKCKKVIGL